MKLNQQDQGPAEFQTPSEISILNNKYLVIGKHALNQRINIFIKLIKANSSIHNPIAQDKIYYAKGGFEL